MNKLINKTNINQIANIYNIYNAIEHDMYENAILDNTNISEIYTGDYFNLLSDDNDFELYLYNNHDDTYLCLTMNNLYYYNSNTHSIEVTTSRYSDENKYLDDIKLIIKLHKAYEFIYVITDEMFDCQSN